MTQTVLETAPRPAPLPKNLAQAWKYVRVVLDHKYRVWQAGRLIGVPVKTLLRHDLSKFGGAEFWPYVRFFNMERSKDVQNDFTKAWHHHVAFNAHHPQYWYAEGPNMSANRRAQFQRRGKIVAFEMEPTALREMVADWFAAARTHTGRWPASRQVWEWYEKDFPKLSFGPATAARLEVLLDEMFEKIQPLIRLDKRGHY